MKKSPRKSKPSKTKSEQPTNSAPVITEVPAYVFENLEEEVGDVIFKPNPGPQTTFLAAPEREVLYGGAAGGGKSYAILADALRDMTNPNFRGLIVRRTTEELRELVAKSQELYPRAYPGIKWSERKMEWKAPSGATLWMSYLERDQDVTRYQGQAFTYIAFDELTQWPTPYAWNYMRSRLRSASKDISLYMRATTNPGGVGHNWVKKMFIDPAPWGESFDATDIDTGETLVWPKGHRFEGRPLFKRRFIPAKLSDNPHLYEDGSYEANLLSLSEHERRRLLEGDWDVIDGNAFPEFSRKLHVIEPFDIPSDWRKFRACDFGYGSASGVLWFAVTPEEELIIFHELYTKKVLAQDLADMVVEIDRMYGRVSYGVLDSSCWHQRGNPGPSIAEVMIAQGCSWRPSDRSKGSRVAGKNEVHRRLQVDEYTERPRMMIFDTCTNLISQLPVLPLDANNPDDVDTKSEDHLYDALRYGCMSRPKSTAWDYYNNNRQEYKPFDSVFGY